MCLKIIDFFNVIYIANFVINVLKIAYYKTSESNGTRLIQSPMKEENILSILQT